jgi:hypothetical protein
VNKQTEGWVFLEGLPTRRLHWFNGMALSACGAWMVYPEPTEFVVSPQESDCCAACKRRWQRGRRQGWLSRLGQNHRGSVVPA